MLRAVLAIIITMFSSYTASCENIRIYQLAGSTMVPLRYVVDWLDGRITPNTSSKCLELEIGGSKARLAVNSPLVDNSMKSLTLPTVPAIVKGVTYVPVSIFRDLFGVDVTWSQEHRTIRLIKPLNEDTLVLPILPDGFSLTELQLDILNLRANSISDKVARGLDLNATDSHGMNALHYAIMMWNIEAAKLLVEAGVDVNVKGMDGICPIHIVIAKRAPYSDILRSVLNTVSLAKVANMTTDSLTDVIGWLIEHGASIDARMTNGSTPLHLAANVGSDVIVNYLLEQGANVNTRDESGLTPLHEAVGFGNLGAAALLMDRKANINARDDKGRSPLHIAILEKQLESVKWLIGKGADIRAKTDEKDVKRSVVSENVLTGSTLYSIPCAHMTPLHLAVLVSDKVLKRDGKGNMTFDDTGYQIARYLIEEGKTDVTALAFGGFTPLHYAADSALIDTRLVELILKNTPKDKVNSRTYLGSTALTIAKKKKNTLVVKLIEAHGGKE